jgi:3-oxoadipate CoA-transferase, alpha subunit
MLDKTVQSLAEAVSGVCDGATLMIGGFGGSGIPTDLIRALLDQGATNLTIVNNNAAMDRWA